jgi:hypothetical protein
MFQITPDKCGGAPGGNCKDVDFNMRTAMKYFADTLDANGGDTLLSIGMYNGWHKGMTYVRPAYLSAYPYLPLSLLCAWTPHYKSLLSLL